MRRKLFAVLAAVILLVSVSAPAWAYTIFTVRCLDAINLNVPVDGLQIRLVVRDNMNNEVVSELLGNPGSGVYKLSFDDEKEDNLVGCVWELVWETIGWVPFNPPDMIWEHGLVVVGEVNDAGDWRVTELP